MPVGREPVADLQSLVNQITRGKPNHLSIEFNPGWVFYQSVKDYLEERENSGVGIDFPDDAEKQKCIDDNRLWEINYYPGTPIANYCVGARTLKLALELMLKTCNEQDPDFDDD